jgi:hypothetical protein
MQTIEELELDILFKEREIQYLSSQILIFERKVHDLQIEYQKLVVEAAELNKELCLLVNPKPG